MGGWKGGKKSIHVLLVSKKSKLPNSIYALFLKKIKKDTYVCILV